MRYSSFASAAYGGVGAWSLAATDARASVALSPGYAKGRGGVVVFSSIHTVLQVVQASSGYVWYAAGSVFVAVCPAWYRSFVSLVATEHFLCVYDVRLRRRRAYVCVCVCVGVG